MALRGTLGDFSLTDILQLIGLQRKTGVLVLRRGEEEIAIGFDNGRVVSADSSLRPAEQRIGRLLVRTGALTEDRLREALQRQRTTLQWLGHVLVERGWVDRETLRRQLRLQITDTIFDLFRWKDGEYDFQPKVVDWDRGFAEPISSESLLMEGARIADEWPLVERFIPSRDLVLKATARASSLLAISPDAAEARGSVYEHDIDLGFIPENPLGETGPRSGLADADRNVLRWVDGRRTVSDIAELSGLGTFEGCHVLANLVKGGLLEPVRAAEPATGIEKSGWLRTAAPARLLAGAVFALAALGAASAVQEVVRALFPGPRIVPATSPIARAGVLADLAGLERLRGPADASRLDRLEDALWTQFLDQGAWPRRLDELSVRGVTPRWMARDPWGEPYEYELSPEGVRLTETAAQGAPPQVRERRFGAVERLVAGEPSSSANTSAP